MAGTIDLYVNRNNTRGLNYGLVNSATDLSRASFPQLVVGDTVYFSLQVTEGDSDGTLETLTGYSIRLGIGTPGSLPTGGTFTVSDGVDTSAAIDYDATATAVQTALNAMNSSAGPHSDTVVVTGAAGGPWKITWDSNGSKAALTLTTSSLTPESGGSVSELVAGDGSTREVQSISLYEQPLILVTSWSISGTQATATVNLNDYDLYAAVIAASGNVIQRTVEIEITDASGNIATLVQTPVNIYADVLPSGAGATSLNLDTYASQAYVDARAYRIKADSGDGTPDYIDNKVANSVVVTAGDTIELDGDNSAPGNSYYYGTNAGGTKGFHALLEDYDKFILDYLYKNYG